MRVLLLLCYLPVRAHAQEDDHHLQRARLPIGRAEVLRPEKPERAGLIGRISALRQHGAPCTRERDEPHHHQESAAGPIYTPRVPLLLRAAVCEIASTYGTWLTQDGEMRSLEQISNF